MSRCERTRGVLFVTSSYPRWAGDSTTPFVHHLARDLREHGWDVQVLAPHAPGAMRAETLDGVPVRRFRYAWPESLQTLCYDGGALVKLRAHPLRLLLVPFLVAAQALTVFRLLVRGRFALVHSHWLLPQGFTCALAARLLRRTHVVSSHGGDVFALQGAVSRSAKRFVLRVADAVTANSEATRQALLSLARQPEKIVRIPMGAGVEVEPDPAEVKRLRAELRAGNGPLLVFVGRLVAEKGAADLLESLATVARSLPDARLAVIGDGPEREPLASLARTLGIGHRVRFTGWLSPESVRMHLLAADIFVGPSRPAPDGWVEAQGLSFVEAMLAELPVVATEIGGIPDAVRHEQTGLLVAPGSPQQITAAVLRLDGDTALSRRLARAARELAQAEFTRAKSAGAFAALYGRLAADADDVRSKK